MARFAATTSFFVGVATAVSGQDARSVKINSATAPLIDERGSHVASGDRFGHSIAGIGDLDFDGNPDLVVGAPGTDGSSGAVWILMMRQDGTVGGSRRLSNGSDGQLSLRAHDGFGSAVAHLGDIDGDGTTDIAVGANGDDTAATNGGAVWILSIDSDAAIVESKKLTGITGGIDGSRSGGILTAMSHPAADRHLIALEGGCLSNGLTFRCAWIWQLTSDGALLNEVSFSPSGLPQILSMSSAGDVDGNGVDDLLVGQFIRNRDASVGGPKIHLALLNKNGAVNDLRILDPRDARYRILDDNTGPAVDPPPIDPDSAFVPNALTRVEDLNGDGVRELVVGSYLGGGTVFEDPPPESIPGTLTIMVPLVENGVVRSTPRATRQFASGIRPYDFNHDRSDRFGVSAANIGDLDQNGTDDLAVGADRDDDVVPDAGAVWIVMNPPLPVPTVTSRIGGQSRPTSGDDARIVALAENLASPIGGATLLFRRAGDESFFSLSMQEDQTGDCPKTRLIFKEAPSSPSESRDCFQAVIPAFAISGHGIEYVVEVSLNVGPVGRTPVVGFHSVSVHLPDGYTLTTEPGAAADGYHMVSFPIDLEDSGALELLESGLGPFRKSKWRFFSHEPAGRTTNSAAATSGTLIEVSERPLEIEPGRGYWLLVRDEGRLIQTGPGQSVNSPFETEIGYGWNLIASPFAFDIALTQVAASSGVGLEALLEQGLVDILAYDGTWSSDVDSLLAGSGYAIFVSECLDEAVCSEVVSGKLQFFSNKSAVPGAATKSTGRGEPAWTIAISAWQGRASDGDNLAGVSALSTVQLDPLDRPEPPLIGDYVSVSFTHTQSGRPQRLRHDIRAPSDGYAWDLAVQSQTTAPVRLEFGNLDSVPASLAIWIFDEVAGVRQNLRQVSDYNVAGPGDGRVRSLKLVVGEAWFVDSELGEAPSLPQSLELSQPFPNPFAGATEFRVGIPALQSVSVDILDVLGRRVRTLAPELRSRSTYEPFMWDGLTDSGHQAASGVYLVRVEGVKQSLVRTVTLIR